MPYAAVNGPGSGSQHAVLAAQGLQRQASRQAEVAVRSSGKCEVCELQCVRGVLQHIPTWRRVRVDSIYRLAHPSDAFLCPELWRTLETELLAVAAVQCRPFLSSRHESTDRFTRLG